MQKQTVQQRYHEQQMMRGNVVPKGVAQKVITTTSQQNYQKLLNAVKQALQEASQAVQQARIANPEQRNLAMASRKLTYAVQQVQQLEIAGVQPGFTKGTEQQLMQLHNQIETAAGTLTMIQQAIE